MSVLYSQNNSPQQSYARCDWKREWRQANYFAFKEMFANFERHIDKHGECKFILVSESGKFNWKRMSGAWDCCLFYSRGIPEPAY